jgi:hypothetical protein
MGLDTKTDLPTDRRSSRNFDFDLWNMVGLITKNHYAGEGH